MAAAWGGPRHGPLHCRYLSAVSRRRWALLTDPLSFQYPARHHNRQKAKPFRQRNKFLAEQLFDKRYDQRAESHECAMLDFKIPRLPRGDKTTDGRPQGADSKSDQEALRGGHIIGNCVTRDFT